MYPQPYFREFILSFATKDFLLYANLASYLYKVIKNSIFLLMFVRTAPQASELVRFTRLYKSRLSLEENSS